MSDILEFVSGEDGAVLRLSYETEDPRSDLLVEAIGDGFAVRVPAYTHMCPSMPEFLDRIENAGVIKSPLSWGTLESEFELEATRDMLGHIFVIYRLRSPDPGSDKWWRFEGRLVLELGALPGLRRSARAFWRDAA